MFNNESGSTSFEQSMFRNGNFGTKLGSNVNFESTPFKMTCHAGDSGPELTFCTEVYCAELRFPGSVWFVSGQGCVWKDKGVI